MSTGWCKFWRTLHMTNEFLNKSNYRSNIPNGDVTKGDIIVPYLQPIPIKGTGYHRYIFVLYKQDKKIDFSKIQLSDKKDLENRSFYTFDFYKEHQDSITPAGLSFFQAKWDESVRDTFHNELSKCFLINMLLQT